MNDRMKSNAEKNQEVYNSVVVEYETYALRYPEQAILGLFKNDWQRFRMLDIGVGAGRTTYTFSALTKEYIGIDYAPDMIAQCKRGIGESETVKFNVVDARDLSQFYDNKFDMIMFSFNGIDAVGHDDRIRILKEIGKVLANDGHFFFSTHSLKSFPFKQQPPAFNARRLLFSLYSWLQHLKFVARMKWHYRNVDANEVSKKPWAILNDGAHGFQMRGYYVDPEFQISQLNSAGFAIKTVYGDRGEPIDPLIDFANHLSFLCQHKESQHEVD